MFRVVASFAIAPLIAALIYAGLTASQSNFLASFRVVLVVAYGQALVLGVPLYLVLRHKDMLTTASIILSAGVVALVPWLIWVTFTVLSLDSYAAEGSVLIEAGSLTTDGYIYFSKILLRIFLCGAVAGVIFAVITRQSI